MMEENKMEMEGVIGALDSVCDLILKKKEYKESMSGCIGAIQHILPRLLGQGEENDKKILQLLQDMMYGMSQWDDVFLLDVLRYGIRPELEKHIDGEEEPEGVYE